MLHWHGPTENMAVAEPLCGGRISAVSTVHSSRKCRPPGPARRQPRPSLTAVCDVVVPNDLRTHVHDRSRRYVGTSGMDEIPGESFTWAPAGQTPSLGQQFACGTDQGLALWWTQGGWLQVQRVDCVDDDAADEGPEGVLVVRRDHVPRGPRGGSGGQGILVGGQILVPVPALGKVGGRE